MKHPIVLAQFQTSKPWSAWISYGAGIWYTIFTGEYVDVDDLLDAGISTLSFESDVGSVQYQGDPLPLVGSIAETMVVPSFYWDRATRALYVHFPNFDPPDDSVRVGTLYSVGTEFVDAMDGTIFRAHLKNIPPLASVKDRLFFKKISTATWTMVLDNANLDYDAMASWGAYNQPVIYYLGEVGAPFSEFVPIRAGRIRDFSFSGSEVVVNVQDARARLSMKLPRNTLTIADYPYMDAKLSGKLKPMAFGKVYNVIPPCLNVNDPTGPYTFLLADTSLASLHALVSVKIDGASVTPDSYDLDAGTVTLTAAQCKDGTSLKDVLVDFEGYEVDSVFIENPLVIARTILSWIANTPYTVDYYDTEEWGREELYKPNVGLYFSEPIQVLSVLGRLMEATRGGFLVTNDGRYTWRTPNYTGRAKYNITDMDWRDTPEVSYDTSEVLAYARVGYARQVAADTYKFIENSLYETEVFNSFQLSDGEEFELDLTVEDDAETYAADIMRLSSAPAILVTGRVSMNFATMNIGENVQVAVNRMVRNEFANWLGTLRGELLSIAPDPLTGDVEIQVRVVDSISEYVEGGQAGAIYGLTVYGGSSYGEG